MRLKPYFLNDCLYKLQEFAWGQSLLFGLRGKGNWDELTKKSFKYKHNNENKEFVTIKHIEQTKNY